MTEPTSLARDHIGAKYGASRSGMSTACGLSVIVKPRIPALASRDISLRVRSMSQMGRTACGRSRSPESCWMSTRKSL